MKGIIKILSLTMGLIMLFSAGLLASAYALAAAPTTEKDYEVDRFTDKSLFVKKDSGPTTQSDMQDKFGNYNTLENNVLTFFTKEQAEELHVRKENGELFALSYDEVLFIINDSIQQYYNHDEIVLTNATAYGLIPEEKIQSSVDHHIYCNHDDLSELPYLSAEYKYQEVRDDIYCIIVYRLSMLDSSFVLCEQYVTDDLSKWLILDGQTPVVLVPGKGKYGIESIKTFYLKLKWMSASLKVPILIMDYKDKVNMIRVCESDGLTLSTVYPTAELKEKAPVYDPTKEINKYDRLYAELVAKDLMPDYDLSKPTIAFPLKYYKDGISGDGNGLKEGMMFSEMVEQFGLPYNGITSGFFTLRYFTEEGKEIVLYCNPRYSVETNQPEDFAIGHIHWPKDIDG